MFLAAALALASPGTVILNGAVYDGTGRPPRRVDVRLQGDRIEEVLKGIVPRPGETVIDAKGLAVAPGFIDSHSHADGGIFENPTADTQVRQGITTAVVGQDGGSNLPLLNWFDRLANKPTALNFASFVGHGTVRRKVMGDSDRKATPADLRQMSALVAQEMRSGAIGLSSGLEYQPGRYADTTELVYLAKEAARGGGMYISHMRNEDNSFFEAAQELIEISRGASIPAQINHIKLGSARVWGRASEALDLMAKHNLTADVYPYLYWQSTIRVLIPTEEFGNRALWEQGLKDVGGPANVLLTRFSPDPSWQGRTIAQLSQATGKDAVSLIQEIIERCYGAGNEGSESVVVTAMSEADLRTFIKSPRVMFCSDGGLRGSHPRGAGSFPRILGEYVREQKVISLAEAIRKMTSAPARRFGLKDRGLIAPGKLADLVIFSPESVTDRATTSAPQAAPVGIPTVLVNGVPVLRDGRITGALPGRPLRKGR